MNFNDRDERTALAGEYVLGVLLPAEKREFEYELQNNRELTDAVAFWQDHLLEITPAPEPVEPSHDLWSRIERNLPGRAVKPQKSRKLWNNLVFWRASGLIGLAASTLLALGWLFVLLQPLGPEYLAVLQAPDKGASWLVEIDSQAVGLRPLSLVNVDPGNSIQFWTKLEGAAGPTSLGLVSPDKKTKILLNKLPGLDQNQLFEVTLEPKSGSPIDRPTGPILAVGKSVRL